ncbi:MULTISPECIES: MFS transporter [unclassified Bordetella]|uniref:MFS transporter n=1 Tax=unclassified Bordetella TaxID=2630031 RepID=UPI001328B5EC|nr:MULTISPECIES: MFS transporter [unclassified Bordetella]MVW72026.1 MFS transporter [Bordetella sp. 15P40C-2]MVW78741.1 MFS transporter [Bordetella sp. 02P26C-1]
MTTTHLGSTPRPDTRRRHRTRDVIAANFGTFFEWFDLLVYAMFAITISKLFFPQEDEQSALLFSLMTFASSFLIRPVGAVVLGIMADKLGRRTTLSIAAMTMLAGTALIAVAPTYETIGVWAPIILVTGRLLQGFSVGGEFGTANSYLTEQSPSKKAFFASLQFSTSGLAVMTASLFALVVNHFLTPEQVNSWGWRLPFIFGCLIGPVGLYIRAKIDETQDFEELKQQGTAKSPLGETFKFHTRYVLIGAVITAAGVVASFLNIYMPTFAINNLGISKDSAFTASICSGLVCTFLPMVGGICADRFGVIKVMRIALVLGVILVFPLFYMLTSAPSLLTLIVFQCTLSTVFYSFYFSPVGSLLAQLFPTSCRTTGVSIAYVIAQTFFGGVTPLVVGFLVAQSGSIMAPAYYIVVIAAAALLGLHASRHRVK